MNEMSTTKIPDELIQMVSGGTPEENAELIEYVRRKYPDFDKFNDPNTAVCHFLFENFDLKRYSISLDYAPGYSNTYEMWGGETLGHEELMEMMRAKFGD